MIKKKKSNGVDFAFSRCSEENSLVFLRKKYEYLMVLISTSVAKTLNGYSFFIFHASKPQNIT
jgi:hypothetical protein